MTEPSGYELEAWRDIQRFKGRLLSRVTRNASEQLATGAAKVGERASKYLENKPRTRSAVSRGQQIVARSADAVGSGACRTADAIPDGVADWRGAAFGSIRQAVGRVSRVGLSPKRVVARHGKLGHDVAALSDLRRLDLEQIDAVRGRGARLYYPAIAAASGAGAGLAVSGGALVTAASAGAAAAPSAGAIAGALAGDAAVVLGLASRAVGQVSLLYGYDPEEPGEKLFVMSVINAGPAMSSGAKTAAMADVSRLTQSLVRGKARPVLEKSLIAQVYRQFGKAFGVRITKQSLGKIVPAAGIVVGSAFNWTPGKNRRCRRYRLPATVPPREVPEPRRRRSTRIPH